MEEAKAKIILLEMIEIFEPGDEDWMGYIRSTTNFFTYHHLIKQCYGGPTTIDNGAILTKNAHNKLNRLYICNPLMFDLWQELFWEINKSMCPPTSEHKEKMLEYRYLSKSNLYPRK